ncbi:hypothetical protein CAEBREN_31504 [Caenorhabditis brenneri]|uniref:Receptor L-domain domain-containing protein n=1 Tax=Caenorhabditis brenneri TaxID=135651 RepID=G0MUG4_CAEBE|nr:hypothetical protein CAEBREN_31504 [Caenorhabditis brenneri]
MEYQCILYPHVIPLHSHDYRVRGYGTTISNNNKMIELGFANLQYLKCNSFLIVLNAKLERLDMPKLIKMMWYVEKDITVWILYSSPDFCLDAIAAKVFTKVRDPFYTDIDASTFCEPKFDEKMCKTPSAGCVEIFGNVEIGPGFDMGVMRNVEVIYGNLVIKNTTIVDLNGFESLQYIISLDNIDPVLLVEGNSQLVNATFPKLERIKSSSESEAIVFKGNNKQLLSDATSCILLYFALYSSSDIGPTFDGQSCMEILDATENATTTISPIIVSTTEKAVYSSTGNATLNDNKTRETANHFKMIFLLLVMYYE